MKYRHWHLLIMLLGAVACAGWNGKLDEKNYLSGQSSRYDKLIVSGFKAIKSKDYVGARDFFKSALDIPRHEEPNYEAYLPLALSECKLGNNSAARVLLKDFTCMLKIDAGIIKCPSDRMRDLARIDFSKQCDAVMCGEIFLPYYSQISHEKTRQIQSLQDDLYQVSIECDIRL